MSLDSEVAQLTGEANALISTFQKKSADIDAATQAALAAALDFDKEYFVDSVNGDDGNVGDMDNPLASIQAAAARCGKYINVRITLMGDYTCTERAVFNSNSVVITSLPGEKYVLKIGIRNSGNGYAEGLGVELNGICDIQVSSVTLKLPGLGEVSGGYGANDSFTFGSNNSSSSQFTHFKFTYVTFDVPVDTIGLCYIRTSGAGLYLYNCDYIGDSFTNLSGHWFNGLSAGREVSGVDWLMSNGISSL